MTRKKKQKKMWFYNFRNMLLYMLLHGYPRRPENEKILKCVTELTKNTLYEWTKRIQYVATERTGDHSWNDNRTTAYTAYYVTVQIV